MATAIFCPRCNTKIFPPRDVCPSCGGEARTAFAFSGKGEVFSYTTIYEAPAGYDETAPYTVALVKLEEGPQVTAQLTDLGDQPIEIGMPVEMVTRRLPVPVRGRQDGDERGMLIYTLKGAGGYKFRPVLSRGA